MYHLKILRILTLNSHTSCISTSIVKLEVTMFVVTIVDEMKQNLCKSKRTNCWEVRTTRSHSLGTFYSMGKGRDHENVRALETHSNAQYYEILRCHDIRDHAFSQMLFHYHLIHVGPCTQQAMIMKGCNMVLKCRGLPNLF